MEKNSRTSRHFLSSPALSFFFPPSSSRGRSLLELGLDRVPGVPEALYGLGAPRGIRELPLAGAFSGRHVCFSVVKRAAGHQTGLNQPPTSLRLFLFFFLLFSLSPPAGAPPASPSLAFALASLPLLRALRTNRIHRSRSMSQSGRVTNCFLFERTN